MKFVDFKKFTDENGAMPIYLFEGEEGYFRQRGEAQLKSRFLQEPTLDYTSFDGANLKGERMRAIADALNAFPFMSERRVVRITEFFPTEKEYETYLKDVFENPPASGLLMIINSAKPKTGYATLQKKPNVTFVDCSKADEETIKKWIYLTCKREGVYIDGVTSGMLCGYCNFDMSRISMETEKLLTYAKASAIDKIGDELVQELVYPDVEYRFYELTNAIARKNYSSFMRILSELQTKGNNEITLLSSLASYFKGLYETSLCVGTDKDVALTLGIKEYSAKKNREQVQKLGKKAVQELYQSVYGAISDVKSGKQTPPSALKTVTARLFFEKQ